MNFPVEFTLGGKFFRERASTLSGGGLFIVCKENLEPGATLSLQFRPAKHLPSMEAKGRICYQIPDQGAAVEFTEINPEHRDLLLRLIHHKTGDKRRFPRSPLATQIECQQCLTLAFSRDVSLGGMFVETPRPLPVNTEVHLRFHLGDDGPVVVTVARVAYQVAKLGMGVEFEDLSPEDSKRLEAYLARSVVLPTSA